MQTDKIPNWKKALGILSISGFILALLVHLLTFFGIEASDYVRGVWLLHLGIFAVGIPIIIIQKSEKNYREMFHDHSKWVQALTVIFTVYTLANFIFFIYWSSEGSPVVENGHYFLQNHGKFIRTITENEYYWERAYILRGFSGHWMMFYFIATSTYFSKSKDLFNNP